MSVAEKSISLRSIHVFQSPAGRVAGAPGVIATMETGRMRTLQQPAHVEKLLETLVVRSDFLPKDSYQIRDPSALPFELQTVLGRAAQEGRIWGCWANSSVFCLFTCELSLALSRERGTPVLLVNRYDEGGVLKDAGCWTTSPDGKWQRLADR